MYKTDMIVPAAIKTMKCKTIHGN